MGIDSRVFLSCPAVDSRENRGKRDARRPGATLRDTTRPIATRCVQPGHQGGESEQADGKRGGMQGAVPVRGSGGTG